MGEAAPPWGRENSRIELNFKLEDTEKSLARHEKSLSSTQDVAELVQLSELTLFRARGQMEEVPK